MIIEVTQEDIDNGRPMTMMSNPLSRAMNRVLGTEYGRWQVDSSSACTSEQTVALPENAQRWLRKFDHCKDVKPFRFEVPDNWESA